MRMIFETLVVGIFVVGIQFQTPALVSATANIENSSLQTNVGEKEKKFNESAIFPRGEKLPEQFSKYFIGQAYMQVLTKDKELNCPIVNVTFEPGCRNNWHSHTGGQVLIVTGGRGWYQEEGKEARELKPGDVVEIRPNVKHWHGAAKDSWFSHLAIETNAQNGSSTKWFGPVTDEEYNKLNS